MDNKKPWYAGKNQDTIFYLLIAIFIIEMIVGGIAFFYGIMHARPEMAGGPPVARFPWFYWAIASFLAPAGFLLIVHLTGSILSSSADKKDGETPEEVPERLRRFYASVRYAPAIVILTGILLSGLSLFFIDGAFSLLKQFLGQLAPYIPWICGSLAILLAVCFITHAIMVYRQRKLESEYAWRREVLEKTGLVITDKGSIPVSIEATKSQALPAARSIGELPQGDDIVDVSYRDNTANDNRED